MTDSSTMVPETSSRCITERITETFNFEVTNYPQIKSRAVGEFISSGEFRVDGYDWRINFYPNGADADSAGNASAYVQLTSRGKDARAKFTLSVLERDGQATVASHDAVEKVYSQDADDWGFPKFVARSELKSLSRQGDGSFTIRCVLTVMNESPPLELLGHLERMLHDGTGADVTFGVGGRNFRAHRCLLAARSPVFREKLFSPTIETDMPRIEVVDVDPTIFEIMLHYIYTDSLPPCSDDEGDHNSVVFQHLLVAAKKYGLETLMMMCEDELCKRMDVETVMARFSLAKEHSCKRLEDACMVFMSSPEVLRVVLENVNFKDT